MQQKDEKAKKRTGRKIRGKKKKQKSKSETVLPRVMQPPNADLAHETKIPKCARYPSSFKHAGHYLNITLGWA
jgi:hypothetical protein